MHVIADNLRYKFALALCLSFHMVEEETQRERRQISDKQRRMIVSFLPTARTTDNSFVGTPLLLPLF